eukprot:scaffold66_cov390-Prasinococcus_capsulatus_cf.AAC.1
MRCATLAVYILNERVSRRHDGDPWGGEGPSSCQRRPWVPPTLCAPGVRRARRTSCPRASSSAAAGRRDSALRRAAPRPTPSPPLDASPGRVPSPRARHLATDAARQLTRRRAAR